MKRTFHLSSIRKRIGETLLMAAIAIPTQSGTLWEQETYAHVPKNEVSFSKQGILIRINRSASPLIYPFDSTKKIIGFHVRGEFRGLPKFSNVDIQGEKGADDYPLRVGFVVPGEKRLTGLKKLLAPSWIVKLYSKVPNGSGLDRIQFFNVTQNAKQIGRSRLHPLSNLIREDYFATVFTEGPFDYEYAFKKPLDAAAIWISSDGDDTKSVFEVVISSVEVSVE